jgi:chromosome segregation ATPase
VSETDELVSHSMKVTLDKQSGDGEHTYAEVNCIVSCQYVGKARPGSVVRTGLTPKTSFLSASFSDEEGDTDEDSLGGAEPRDALDRLAQTRQKLRTGEDVIRELAPDASSIRDKGHLQSLTSISNALAATISSNTIILREVEFLRKQRSDLVNQLEDLQGYKDAVSTLLVADKEKSAQISEQAELLNMLSEQAKSKSGSAGGQQSLQSAYNILLSKLEHMTQERNRLYDEKQILIKELSLRPSEDQVFELQQETKTLQEQLAYQMQVVDSILSLEPDGERRKCTDAIAYANSEFSKRGLEIAILTAQRNAQHRHIAELSHQLYIVTTISHGETNTPARPGHFQQNSAATDSFGWRAPWSIDKLNEWRTNNPLIAAEVASGLLVLPENTLLPSAKYTSHLESAIGSLLTDHSSMPAAVRIAELQLALIKCHDRVEQQEKTLMQAQTYIAFQEEKLKGLDVRNTPAGIPSAMHKDAGLTLNEMDIVAESHTELASKIEELEAELSEAVDLRDAYFQRLESGALYVKKLKDELEAANNKIATLGQVTTGGGDPPNTDLREELEAAYARIAQYESQLSTGSQYLHELSSQLTLTANENQELKALLEGNSGGGVYTEGGLQEQLQAAEERLTQYEQNLTAGSIYLQEIAAQLAEKIAENDELKLQLEHKTPAAPGDDGDEHELELEELRNEIDELRELNEKYLVKLKKGSEVLATMKNDHETQRQLVEQLMVQNESLKTQCEEYMEKIRQLESSIQEIKSTQVRSMASPNINVTEPAVSDDGADTAEDVTILKEEIEELRATNEAYVAKLQKGSEYLVGIRKQLADAQSIIAERDMAVQKMSDQNTQLSSTVSFLEAELESVRSASNSDKGREAEYSALESQATLKVQELLEKYNESRSLVTELQSRIEEMTHTMNGVPMDESRADTERWNEKWQDSMAELAVLSETNSELLRELEAANTKIIALQAQLTSLQSADSELKAQLDAALISNNNNLDLKSALAAANSKVASLQSNYESMQLVSVSLEANAAKLQFAVERDANMVAALKAANTELHSKVERLEAQIAEANKKPKEMRVVQSKDDVHIISAKPSESSYMAGNSVADSVAVPALQRTGSHTVIISEAADLEPETEGEDVSELKAELAELKEMNDKYIEKLKAGSAFVERLKGTISSQAQEIEELTLRLETNSPSSRTASASEPITAAGTVDADMDLLRQQLEEYEDRMRRGSEMLKSLRTELSEANEAKERLAVVVEAQQHQLRELTAKVSAAQSTQLREKDTLIAPLEQSLRAYQTEMNNLRKELVDIEEEGIDIGTGDANDSSFALSEGVEFVDKDDFDMVSVMDESGVLMSPVPSATAGGSAYGFNVDHEVPITPFNVKKGHNDVDISPVVQYNSIYPSAVSSSPRLQSKSEIQIAGAVNVGSSKKVKTKSSVPSSAKKVRGPSTEDDRFDELDKSELIRRLFVLKAAVAAKDEMLAAKELMAKSPGGSARSSPREGVVSPIQESPEAVQLRNVLIRLSDLAYNSHLRIAHLRAELASVKTKHAALIAVTEAQNRLSEQLAQIQSGYECFPNETIITAVNEMNGGVDSADRAARDTRVSSVSSKSVHSDTMSTPIRPIQYSMDTPNMQSVSSSSLRDMLSSATAKASVETIRKDYSNALRAKQVADQLLVSKEFQLRKLTEQLDATKAALAAAEASASRSSPSGNEEAPRMSIRHLSMTRRNSQGGTGGSVDSPGSAAIRQLEEENKRLEIETERLVHELVSSKMALAQLSADLDQVKKSYQLVNQKYKEASRHNNMLQSELDDVREKLVEAENRSMFGKFTFRK